MPFVLRNSKGDVTGMFAVRQHEGQEFLDDDNPEVAACFFIILWNAWTTLTALLLRTVILLQRFKKNFACYESVSRRGVAPRRARKPGSSFLGLLSFDDAKKKVIAAGLPPAVLSLVIHVSIRPSAYSTRTAFDRRALRRVVFSKTEFI